MTLKPGNTTALHDEAAAAHGRAALERALGGRPSIDPSTKPGQHSRTRQVRLPHVINTKLDEVAAAQNRPPSEIMRAALAEYLEHVDAEQRHAVVGGSSPALTAHRIQALVRSPADDDHLAVKVPSAHGRDARRRLRNTGPRSRTQRRPAAHRRGGALAAASRDGPRDFATRGGPDRLTDRPAQHSTPAADQLASMRRQASRHPLGQCRRETGPRAGTPSPTRT